MDAIYRNDFATMREISRYFYQSSGIYQRLCKYLAYLYRFDYYVDVCGLGFEEPSKAGNKKMKQDFYNALLYLEKSDTKRMLGNIALDMIVDGCYYGMLVDFGNKFAMQPLPPTYCRSRYFSGVDPVVELNLAFFDAYFPNQQQRQSVLSTFPKDLQKAYVLYKNGKLPGDYPGDVSYWYPLEPGTSVKISLNNNDFPTLVGVIPSILDLDQAQDLDRQKTVQQLLKIIVQKLPLDKNGDLIFDMEEAADIHENAVAMLKRAVGIDVLTTFADIIKIDTKDNNSATTRDDLEKVERTVYNNAGVSRNMFNADGNLAITNAVLTDEASIRDIPLQFSQLLTRVISKFNKRNHYDFIVNVLETTQFNYKEMSKMYKEQTQMGFSKMLPQIALGHSQLSILSTIMFENKVLNLAETMIPPAMSSTMSGSLVKNKQNNQQQNQNNQNGDKTPGRPEKEDSQKSDKTLANRRSM